MQVAVHQVATGYKEIIEKGESEWAEKRKKRNRINSQEKRIDSGYLEDRKDEIKFYKKKERLHQGAMGVQIELPEPFASENFSLCSPNEYCERYHVHRECAKSILNFYMIGNSSFKSYLSIKSGGIDFWSKKSEKFIVETLEEQGMNGEIMLSLVNVIKVYIASEKEQLTCLRWYMRGLPLKDCIRKVLVNMEVSENCR